MVSPNLRTRGKQHPGLNRPVLNTNRSSKRTWNGSKLIAHAFGKIYGQEYTNSYEAFRFNYKRGFRTFETDLIQLTDGEAKAVKN